MIRQNFENSMTELQEHMVDMAEQTIVQMEKAFNALQTQNIELALRVIEDDLAIDTLEDTLNELAVWVITKQQPVARDLRKIISVTKIASDLERIADFAVNIAKSTIKIGSTPQFLNHTSILEMKTETIAMLKLVMEAYTTEQFNLAKQVGKLDDKIDEKHYANIDVLKQCLQNQTEHVNELVELLLINRFIERSADHITNIAESTAYVIKGQMFDLN